MGEQGTDLVAAQHPPSVDVGHRGGAPVGVRVVGDDQVAPRVRRPGPSPGPWRPAPPGWGTRPSGSRRRAAPAGTRRTARRSPRSRAPARPTYRRRRAAACTTSRRSRGPSPASAGHGVQVGVDHAVAEDRPAVAARYVGERADRVDVGGDLSRRPGARSGCRRRGRPCTRCRAAGCGSRSPSRRPRSPARGSRRRAAAWAAAAAAPGRAGPRRSSPRRCRGRTRRSCGGRRTRSRRRRRGRCPASLRYAASPAAARVTTTRFIRFGARAELAAEARGAELERAVERGRPARPSHPGRGGPRAPRGSSGRDPRRPRRGPARRSRRDGVAHPPQVSRVSPGRTDGVGAPPGMIGRVSTLPRPEPGDRPIAQRIRELDALVGRGRFVEVCVDLLGGADRTSYVPELRYLTGHDWEPGDPTSTGRSGRTTGCAPGARAGCSTAGTTPRRTLW